MNEDIDAIVSELLDAGVLPNLAVSIVARAIAIGSVDVSAERRRKKDRERKAEVRRNLRKSADKADTKSPPKVPPITPLNTPLTPKPNGLGADAPLPDYAFYKRGKEIFGKTSGGFLAKLLRAVEGNALRGLEVLEAAAVAENAREYVGRVMAGSPQTEKQRSKAEWKGVLDEIESFANGSGSGSRSGSPPLRLLPPVTGE